MAGADSSTNEQFSVNNKKLYQNRFTGKTKESDEKKIVTMPRTC